MTLPCKTPQLFKSYIRPDLHCPDVVKRHRLRSRQQEESNDPTEFNPRGDYFILGRKPKEFREFDCLELAVDENSDGKVLGRVMIQTYAEQTYTAIYAVSGVVNKQRISLVARPAFEEGVGYRFEGEFLRQGVLWRAGKSRAVLKGRLSKIKGGEKIAEALVKFRIEYLGC